jgi:hypothetical protein
MPLQGEGESPRTGAKVNDDLGVSHHLGGDLVEAFRLGTRHQDPLVDQEVERTERSRALDVLKRLASETTCDQLVQRVAVPGDRFEPAQLMRGDLIQGSLDSG